MNLSMDFALGLAIGLNLMLIVAMVATDQLIRHYIRKGWLRFPPRKGGAPA